MGGPRRCSARSGGPFRGDRGHRGLVPGDPV